MSDSISFKDLVNLTFSDGSVHLKHLQMLFKILVQQLVLDDVKVSHENLTATELEVLAGCAADPSCSTDPVTKAVPKSENLLKNICDSKSNPIADMFNVLNITKRLEAVELSVQQMTSLFDTILEKEAVMEEMIKNCQPTVARKSIGVDAIDDELEELKEHETPRPSLQTLSNFTIHSGLDDDDDCSSTSVSGTICEPINIEEIVKKQVESQLRDVNEKLEKLKQDFCEIQKEMFGFKEDVADAMFANEQIDGFFNETINEIESFNSKVFCLKTDVKTLIQDGEGLRTNFAELDSKCEAMNIAKANKSYVDELLGQKAYKSDLNKFVTTDEFDVVCDVLRFKVALLDENLPKLRTNMKAHLACLKTEISDKLDKCQLKAFKDQASKSFEVFLNDLKSLLLEMSEKPLGSGGFQALQPETNCVCCESRIQMKKSTIDVPRLGSASIKFQRDLDQSAVKKCKSNATLRDVLKLAQTPETSKVGKVGCEKKKTNLLNFPNSQPYFEIGPDQVVTAVDPLKSLKSGKFL